MHSKSNFLSAMDGLEHEKVPVWFMRQAGRYMPSYQEVRKRRSIKEICRDPAVVEEVSFLPVRELGVDAAIIFSDILLPAEAMGFDLRYQEGLGPVISNPFGSPSRSSPVEYDASGDIYSPSRAIKIFREKHASTPIIGFCGGPITVASYLIKGESDRDLAATRTLMYRNPSDYDDFLQMVTEAMITVLKSQISAGCDAVQIFDSWAGSLSREQFTHYREKFLSDLFSELGHARSIYFSTSSWHLLDQLRQVKANFLSLDWKNDLSAISPVIGDHVGLQGNMDPVLAQTGGEACNSEAMRITESMLHRKNYVFNLGHGVLPGTNPDTLRDIVNIVHSYSC